MKKTSTLLAEVALDVASVRYCDVRGEELPDFFWLHQVWAAALGILSLHCAMWDF